MDRSRALMCCRGWLFKRRSYGRFVGALPFDSPHRAGLVWLRVGDSAHRNRLSCDLSVSAARWPPISASRTASGGALAVSLVNLPDYAWRRIDQDPRRLGLAGSYSIELSLRNAATSESTQPLVSLSAQRSSQGGRRLQPHRRAYSAVVRFLALSRSAPRWWSDCPVSTHPHCRRKSFLLELVDHRTRAGVF